MGYLSLRLYFAFIGSNNIRHCINFRFRNNLHFLHILFNLITNEQATRYISIVFKDISYFQYSITIHFIFNHKNFNKF